MKKLIVVIVVTGLLVLAAYAGWRFFGRDGGAPPLPTPTGGPTDTPPVQLPTPIASQIKALTANRVFAYWINKNTETMYYLTDEGEIYKLAQGGTEQKLSGQPIQNLRAVSPSPDGPMAIVSFGQGERIFFSAFNSVRLSWQPLPAGALAAAWDPTGTKIAYLEHAGLSAALKILSLADAKIQEVTKINVEDAELSWVVPKEIYLTSRPSANYPGSVLGVNLEQKTVRVVVRDEPGLMVLWSQSGPWGIKFSLRGRRPVTEIIDGNGQMVGAWPFAPTLPVKCLAENVFFYCGAPRSMGPRDIWPDDYLQRRIYSKDDVVFWNASTSQTAIVIQAEQGPFDVIQLSLLGNKLFFVNRYDGKLYEATLPAPPSQTPESEEGTGGGGFFEEEP